jgi:hypothetical protein
MPPVSFWGEARKKLRPHALSWVVEFGQYLMLWATVAGAHVVRVVMGGIGLDHDFVEKVAWVEKWVFLASFLSFFCRILIRLYRSVREEAQ